MAKKVAIVVGSLRKGSFSRLVAKTCVELAPDSLSFEFIDIGKVSLYNQDQDTDNPPASWKELRDAIRPLDAVLFFTPEYNRGMPGMLKNAIDIASRPYGKSAWDGKPCAVVSVSPGAMGAFGANHHLRQSLVFLNMPAMPQPEAYVGNAAKMFDEGGKMTNDATREFLKKFMATYAVWVARHTPQ
ncbi:MAG: NADPH-dependent FMN reductase [Rhodospirillales bacterium]